MDRVRIIRTAVIVAAVLALPSVAEAQLRGLVKGLSLFDVRFSGEQNLLGDGITIDAAAFYNNRRFNFGLADLTLTGQLRGSAGFTRRILPTAEFSLNTGGVPLNYTFNINTGMQDLTAVGSVLIDIDTHVNALGFYDQTFQISNRGSYFTDGFGLRDGGTLDFDVGPINVSGNIFADFAAAVTEPFFASTGTMNPFAKFSGRAQKAAEISRSSDELRARIDAGEILSDEEIATLVNNTIIAALLGTDPSDDLFSGLMLPPDLLLLDDGPQLQFASQPVPEPGSLWLLSLGILVLRRSRLPGRTLDAT